jgi:hypothetical protein
MHPGDADDKEPFGVRGGGQRHHTVEPAAGAFQASPGRGEQPLPRRIGGLVSHR